MLVGLTWSEIQKVRCFPAATCPKPKRSLPLRALGSAAEGRGRSRYSRQPTRGSGSTPLASDQHSRRCRTVRRSSRRFGRESVRRPSTSPPSVGRSRNRPLTERVQKAKRDDRNRDPEKHPPDPDGLPPIRSIAVSLERQALRRRRHSPTFAQGLTVPCPLSHTEAAPQDEFRQLPALSASRSATSPLKNGWNGLRGSLGLRRCWSWCASDWHPDIERS